MGERIDLDGRDPATYTELEKLAYIYPAVAEVVRERDMLRAGEAVRELADRVDRIGELERELAELRAMERRAREVQAFAPDEQAASYILDGAQ